MDLSKIVSIGGRPGLFKVTGQAKTSVIVESLLDGKRFPAFVHDKVSSLAEISIFTEGEDRPLKEVFLSIKEKMGDTLEFDVKKLNNNELRDKFVIVVPDYNTENVYPSDMKKVFVWYQLLSDHQLIDAEEPIQAENENIEQEAR